MKQVLPHIEFGLFAKRGLPAFLFLGMIEKKRISLVPGKPNRGRETQGFIRRKLLILAKEA
jgi:hypothetical protein